MMKKLMLITLLLGMSAANAETVTEKIIEHRDWMAVKVDDHKVTKKSACVAKTKKGKMTLEIYAELAEDGEYTEPVIQVLAKDVEQAFVAQAKGSPLGESFLMSVALPESKYSNGELAGNNQQVFLMKLSDKESLIDQIKRKLKLKTSFIGETGELSKVNFSLSGSSKTVAKMFEACGLN